VSHDLKNPLNAIELRERVLERRTTEPAIKEHTLTVRRTVATMQRMIRGLLDAASIQAGKLKITKDEHDLADVIASVVDVLSPVAKDQGIELRVTCAAGSKRTFDHDRIEQVLYNLVSNALKFTPEGGSITISIDYTPTETLVSVADTGAGIDPDALPKIFDKFFTTGGRSAGTGLGLDIAKSLVEAHGGRIWAESTVDVGSTFSFSLPVA
ncbi:MAG TPA: HAMP domain-containing sensor histidine kinase, partial [Kofleriaceae bacterium]|nr:HAMP domain-containing sensor histidine kinase [Kofleriaceae bacterium]